ncbi:hypothetical protein KUW00_06525 [Halomonas sp. DP5N14-9]|uniref:hypothetical protein n=1 Tax=Halomonas sp. DP5N14-9 TaxID=2859075 RepID=UPI001C9949D1|nr:hypothetical protein [Halomonas sp. DP5N14-9]MBY5940537.1 hypothetical protein [Halomonas sp. DP5N14-9]
MYYFSAVHGVSSLIIGIALTLYLVRFNNNAFGIIALLLIGPAGFLLLGGTDGLVMPISRFLSWIFLLSGLLFSTYYLYQRFVSEKLRDKRCQNISAVMCFFGFLLMSVVFFESP